ncbi:MAG: Rieske (2Fe-2S) protein [Acidobacteria bacterium]|nr:Rieske (2Fe-2S) protein [Acidobacteriota bacterium]
MTFTPAKIDGAMSIEPGSALNFAYPSEEDTAILIRGTDGTYAAFGQKCTHLSCPVYYSKANDRLECPCHNGGFSSKTGEVLYGPPPRPLDRIELETINGEIFAVKKRCVEMKANVKPQKTAEPRTRRRLAGPSRDACYDQRGSTLDPIGSGRGCSCSCVHSTGSARHCLRYMLADRT